MSRREEYLKAMGLAPLWRARDTTGARAAASGGKKKAVAGSLHPSPPSPLPSPPSLPPPNVAKKNPPVPTLTVGGPTLEEQQKRRDHIAMLDWQPLVQAVHDCRFCDLARERKQAVPGVGDRRGTWLFVGEGPGAEEDERGEPFVGLAGKLLDQMLGAIGLRRGEKVYIANAVKCRPPRNRPPTAEEAAACLPFLERQIALIEPKLIVALGRPAAMTLLKEEVKISAVRGQRLTYGKIPLVVTYHPAYLLRNPPEKYKAWQDLCFMRALMAAEEATPAA